ncbi:MAG: hypothetical protein ABW065_09915 [Solirubrobacterales bacterium]
MDEFPRRRSLLALAISLIASLWVVVPSAGASAAIEGVWSFNGGRIAIQESEDGNFKGTVVAATTFSLCSHPVGEEIWTHLAPQADGSYWGLHQWFFESSDCVPNPTLGLSAWRVFQNAGGRYLRACFSEPGSGLQPTVAADGSVANATFGCADSSLVGAAPDSDSAALARSVKLPAANGCVSRRAIRVRIVDPKNDPISKIVVTYRVGGVTHDAPVKRHKRSAVAVVPLGRSTSGSVRVDVRLTTVLGHRWHGSRSYRRCGGKPRHFHVAAKPGRGHSRATTGA